MFGRRRNHPSEDPGATWGRSGVTTGVLSSWEQTVDIHLALDAYVNMPVHHHWDVEAQG